MSAGLALAVALLAAGVAVSVAAAPIWRRLRPLRRPTGTTPVTLVAARLWRDRRCVVWGPVVTALLAGLVGLLAGPVSSAVLAAYGAAAFVIVRGLAVRRSRQRAYRLAADAVVGMAADLRAGISLEPAWQAAQEALRQAQATILPGWRAPAGGALDGDVAVVAARVVAATGLAQASGAPLADVLDRLDSHLRAVDRARSVASSQTAGARVSAGLLAAMPVAGVGLGAVIGVDAWRVLLHTPLGATAVGLAVALQLGGIAWSTRLAATEVMP